MVAITEAEGSTSSMSPHLESKPETKLLCGKGLARRQGLVAFVEPRQGGEADEMDSASGRIDLRLRHDDGVIREVFNARCGELTLLSSSSVQAELSKRETLLRILYRLYQIGRNNTPADLRRQLQPADVEAVISSIQRMSFTGTSCLEEIVEFCETSGQADQDVLAHVIDPLQLRYLLTFHRSATREEIRKSGVDTLISACKRKDALAIKAWFEQLTATTESLPGDAPQYFRSVLLDLWKSGGADLGALAYEIAVLDVQLFDYLGWESTRAFCAQLRRITGPGCEALDAFLTDEDMDGALMIAEELRQDDLITHFRKLVKSYSTKVHRDLRRSVMCAAGHARESESMSQPAFSSSSTNSSAPQPGFRSLGWTPAS